MDRDVFIKLNLALVLKYGESAATLHAFLSNAAHVWKKDERGYMGIWTQYIAEQLGWSKNKVYRIQDKLVQAHLIDYRQGKNQNEQPKYKVL